MFSAADRESTSMSSDDAWLPEPEGQLSVDVLETGSEVIIRSAVAGVRPEDLDITVTQDTVTIRGRREHACATRVDAVAHVEECYWGAFSRSIILPVEVDVKKIDAAIKNGILTIILPKITGKEKKRIKIKDDNS